MRTDKVQKIDAEIARDGGPASTGRHFHPVGLPSEASLTSAANSYSLAT